MTYKTSRIILSISIIIVLSLANIAPAAYADDTTSADATSSSTGTGTQTSADTSTTAATSPTDPGATTSDPSTSSTSDTTSSNSQVDTSSSSSTNASVLDTTNSQASSTASHDDLTIAATTTCDNSTCNAASSTPDLGPAATAEQVNNIASTTQSGFVPADQGGADVTTSPPEASSTSELDTTNSTQSGGSETLSGISTTTTHPTILSGSAVVLANIINMLNTNFVNSSGAILFSNFTDNVPTIDLRDLSLFSGLCGMGPCMGQEGIQLNLVEGSSIDNNIMLDALSGRNFISGTGDSTSSIQTGDAFAGLNIVNMANTNFVNSNYLIVTLNAFRDVKGNIIFPSLLNFFKTLTSSASAGGDSSVVNTATVGNSVAAAADSGDNTISDASSSLISTGSSDAHANVFNQINNELPNSAVSILFRISGTWNGQVFGVPSDVSQVRGPDGSLFIFGATSTPQAADTTLLNATSTADINNNVELSALSGENSIQDASTSLISTGKSFASANIINIANQNIIGKNWILAIINIFGDFNGNISFGRPDLWVGDQVDAPATVQNGSDLTYKITVINNGDTFASNVKLTEKPDFAHLAILGSTLPFSTSTPDALTWSLGSLAPGDAVEVTYQARVKDSPQGTSIINNSTASETEDDNNNADNSDSATVNTTVFGGGGGGWSVPSNSLASGAATSLAPLSVQRVSTPLTAHKDNPTAAEQVIVRNTGNLPVKNVVFHDELRDSHGHFIHDEIWNLDTVAAHEQISINYTIVFATSSSPGIYTLTSELDSKKMTPAIYANGTIYLEPQVEFPTTSSPSVHIIKRGAIAAPAIATTTLPIISLTASAAAAVSTTPLQKPMMQFAIFMFAFMTSYGALRSVGQKANRLLWLIK